MKPPGHKYTREELTTLKRTEIQRLCKDYGVRANMKTDALIELLLDSIHSNMSPLVRPPQQHHGNIVRRVSTRSSSRTSSLRSRGTSGSSSSFSRLSSGSHTFGHSGYPFSGVSRKNKAKDAQYRLGVGRPTTVGGSGARRSTRSSSLAHSRRGKNSRSFRLPEVVIQEEPEVTEPQTTAPETQHIEQPTLPIEWTTGNSNLLTVPSAEQNSNYNEDWNQILTSVKDLPSQVAWLQGSLQQRENDVVNLHNELHMCKTEITELRSHLVRVSALESELRSTKESLEKIYGVLQEGKGKAISRRVSVPLGENNAITNSPRNSGEIPLASGDSSTPKAHDAFAMSEAIYAYTTINTLGKRRQLDEEGEASESVENRENRIEDRTESRPRKALRTSSRRPLQEKMAGSGRLLEKPSGGQESGEESVVSTGTSSGPSTAPSVGTPPPVIHEPQCFNGSQEAHAENNIFNFSFRQAASSTPRNEVFTYFETETFSPGSAIKELAQRNGQQVRLGDHLHAPFEIRRISAAVARPQTPKRQTGPERFRVTAEQVAATPAHEDIPPFDPYAEDLFMQNVNGQFMGEVAAVAPQLHGFPTGPMSLNQLGLDTNVSVASPESQTPIARTAYGTEVQNDKRFGDFGRDGLGTASNINFWAPFRC